MARSQQQSALSILTGISVLLMLFAFLYQPWLAFDHLELMNHGEVFIPDQTLYTVYLGNASFSGIRLLLREGITAMILIPLALVTVFVGWNRKLDRDRGLILGLAGLLGLTMPVLFLLRPPLIFVETTKFLANGYWLTVIASVGLLLVAAIYLILASRPTTTAALIPTKTPRQRRMLSFLDRLEELPWWLLITIFLGVLILWSISSNNVYQEVFEVLQNGIVTTIEVTLIAYTLSMIVGLLAGLARVSTNPIIYHMASFYVEIVRGVPMLVLLYYITFVVGPGLVDVVNATGSWMVDSNVFPTSGQQLAAIPVRDLTFKTRAIIALMLGYGAFLSEVFRAGIESIEKGQMEAARSLGMNYVQAMRYVILPQAIRRVLPPLGNNFIAMLKDSSLVSVLGVRDITLLGQFHLTSSFRFFEVYNTVAFLYLSMTLILSMLVRAMEQRLSPDR